MKYFNSGMFHAASGGACLWIDKYAYDAGDVCVCLQINMISLPWPVGFIIITHFNEVASDRATRSLRVMFHREKCKDRHQMVWLGMTGIPNRLYKENHFTCKVR